MKLQVIGYFKKRDVPGMSLFICPEMVFRVTEITGRLYMISISCKIKNKINFGNMK